ncbi:TM2 domain-containing protein [Lysinibacillus fusiformis]|uniref:TM2 domain-containing protein n=1 Tax=Lysinibacillus fusiformis TaxID=28031 RepID=UPI003D00142E
MNSIAEKLEITSEKNKIAQKKKSKGVAYALWVYTGIVGGHRYYVGDTKKALAMTLTLGGLGIWAIADILQIERIVHEYNVKEKE